MKFSVLQLSGCAGCEVSLLDADDWLERFSLASMPLVDSTTTMPPVDVLLVTGGVRSEDDLYRLKQAAAKAGRIVAVGTCAISGGVASLGDRDSVRQQFLAGAGRHGVPHMLPKCRPIDSEVECSQYLPGCPPTPALFMELLSGEGALQTSGIVCKECGRKKKRELRPSSFSGDRLGAVDPETCLVSQGFLCVGSSTRNGCGAPCPRGGQPCVGCRGPSDTLLAKGGEANFEALGKIFKAFTDIAPDEVQAALRSPWMGMFLFQFAGASDKRTKEKVL